MPLPVPFLLSAGVIAAVFLAFWLQPPSTVDEASASKKTRGRTPDGKGPTSTQ